jgi:hypothetical protein
LAAHVICRRTSEGDGSRRFPRRLLQIDEPALGMVQVRNVDRMKEKNIQYITLSHCWGLEDFLTLKTTTVDRLQSGIAVADLPQTFRDAITIVRSLGMELLWVDSLCILQDSEDDWRAESSKMADIYSGSTCNIAASASPSASAGCFFERDDSFIRPCTVDVAQYMWKKNARFQIYDTQMFNEDFKTGPLRSRGWVMQEVLLAPRVMYFHRRQIWWECLGLLACEMYPCGLPAGITIDSAHKGLSRIKSWKFAGGQKSEDFKEGLWEKIIEDYSACELTRPEDKLIALSGIAKVMRDILKDEYIVGLWKGTLDSQLLWQRPPKSPFLERPAQYRAPSWSWASVNGPIVAGARNYTSTARDATLIRIVDIQLQTPTTDLTGQVTSGFLRLSGPLMTIKISKQSRLAGPWKSSEYTGSVYDRSSKSWAQHQIVPRFDTRDDDVETRERSYYLLQVRKWHYICECLLLLRCEDGKLRRCGVLSIPHDLADESRPPLLDRHPAINFGDDPFPLPDEESHASETTDFDSLEPNGKDYIISIV